MIAPALRDLTAAYLREHPDWREHPEHGWTHLRWEHLPTGDRLATDTAAVRQMAADATALREEQ